MKIFKARLRVGAVVAQMVPMPASAQILHVGLDGQGVPCLWYTTNGEENINREVVVAGTGQEFNPGSKKHIGSVTEGPYVWHVFA
jgi:hypothetical protein